MFKGFEVRLKKDLLEVLMKNSGKTRAEILASRVSVLCVAASMVVPQNVYAEGTEENSPLPEHSEKTSEVVNSGSEEAPAAPQENTESASENADTSTEAIPSEPAEQVNPVQSEKTEQKQEVQAVPEIRQVALKRTIEFKDAETGQTLHVYMSIEKLPKYHLKSWQLSVGNSCCMQ